jgi:hypothetical protein
MPTFGAMNWAYEDTLTILGFSAFSIAGIKVRVKSFVRLGYEMADVVCAKLCLDTVDCERVRTCHDSYVSYCSLALGARYWNEAESFESLSFARSI